MKKAVGWDQTGSDVKKLVRENSQTAWRQHKPILGK
jgi:hypothetical protein